MKIFKVGFFCIGVLISTIANGGETIDCPFQKSPRNVGIFGQTIYFNGAEFTDEGNMLLAYAYRTPKGTDNIFCMQTKNGARYWNFEGGYPSSYGETPTGFVTISGQRVLIPSGPSLYSIDTKVPDSVIKIEMPFESVGKIHHIFKLKSGTLLASGSEHEGNANSKGVLFQSSDEGQTWTKLAFFEDDTEAFRIYETRNILFIGVGTYHGFSIRSSTDQGKTWKVDVETSFPIGWSRAFKFFSDTTGNEVYMGVSADQSDINYLYKYDFDKSTWTADIYAPYYFGYDPMYKAYHKTSKGILCSGFGEYQYVKDINGGNRLIQKLSHIILRSESRSLLLDAWKEAVGLVGEPQTVSNVDLLESNASGRIYAFGEDTFEEVNRVRFNRARIKYSDDEGLTWQDAELKTVTPPRLSKKTYE
jgi:hypothetical protein